MSHEVHDLAAMRPQTMRDSTLQAEGHTRERVPALKFSWGRAQVADTMIEALHSKRKGGAMIDTMQ